MPKKAQQPIVMIHGWGTDSQIWQSLPERLSANRGQDSEIQTLDLPGFGNTPGLDDYSEASLINWMAKHLPSKCYLIGLSLGGMLCRAFAAQHPERVAGLITISSNLKFVANEQYPHAMARDDFDGFLSSWAENSQTCLKRFTGLLAQGDTQQRPLIRQLRSIDSTIDSVAGGGLLQLLGSLNNQPHMAQIQCPSLNIFGESDALVPVAAAANIEHSHIISGAGHLPHLTAADQLIDVLDNFFESQSYRLDKQKVAESFGRAAQRYDAVAQLQHRMGEQLLNSIPNNQAPANILDLGCGTGYHSVQLQDRFPQSQVTGVDISPGMLAYAAAQYPDCTWLCSDAEQMDLAAGSQQLIFSNFALQWCDDLARLAAELHRVLAAEGQLYLVVPGPQTLLELREAWAQVDEGIHVNRFASLQEWQAALTDAGFDEVKLESDLVTEQHQSVRELLLELKNVGAHNNNAGKANHLTGKQQLKALYNAYENYRLPDGTIPATWEIISGVITKSSLPNL